MAWYTKPVNDGKGALALANKALHAYVLEDERAIRGMATATAFSHNAVAKSKEIINEASAIGRDAASTAKRTWGATAFSGSSLGYHAAGGAAIGAGLGAGSAYMNHDDPVRGAMRGGIYGAGLGLAAGAGRSLRGGYYGQGGLGTIRGGMAGRRSGRGIEALHAGLQNRIPLGLPAPGSGFVPQNVSDMISRHSQPGPLAWTR